MPARKLSPHQFSPHLLEARLSQNPRKLEELAEQTRAAKAESLKLIAESKKAVATANALRRKSKQFG